MMGIENTRDVKAGLHALQGQLTIAPRRWRVVFLLTRTGRWMRVGSRKKREGGKRVQSEIALLSLVVTSQDSSVFSAAGNHTLARTAYPAYVISQHGKSKKPCRRHSVIRRDITWHNRVDDMLSLNPIWTLGSITVGSCSIVNIP
jgi:hypothetical protein